MNFYIKIQEVDERKGWNGFGSEITLGEIVLCNVLI